MFYGSKELVLDDKGRLVLPSNYRTEFVGNIVYAVYSFDGCLSLYPEAGYQAIAKDITGLSDFDPKARQVKRIFLANTFRIERDSHGRILLPKPLLEKTKTGKNIIILGVYNKLEVWNTETYQKSLAEEEKNYSRDAQELIGK